MCLRRICAELVSHLFFGSHIEVFEIFLTLRVIRSVSRNESKPPRHALLTVKMYINAH